MDSAGAAQPVQEDGGGGAHRAVVVAARSPQRLRADGLLHRRRLLFDVAALGDRGLRRGRTFRPRAGLRTRGRGDSHRLHGPGATASSRRRTHARGQSPLRLSRSRDHPRSFTPSGRLRWRHRFAECEACPWARRWDMAGRRTIDESALREVFRRAFL